MTATPIFETPRRQLSDRQVEVVDRLVAAAEVEVEVEEKGYEGLSVRNVAKRAGVAPATAYTYFSSKDHLLAELLWRRVLTVPAPIARDDDEPGDRLERAVVDLSMITSGSAAVVAACTQALLSSNPDVKVLREKIGADIHRRLSVAGGGHVDPLVVSVLVTTYFGALLSAGMGHMAYEQVPDFVVTASSLMTARDR